VFPDDKRKIDAIESFKSYKGSIHHWLQQIFFSCLDPFLIDKNASWLTLGDAFGHDAGYLIEQGLYDVMASDLNTDFLEVSNALGMIREFKSENAENLSYNDLSLDYILCKESYHHFPRPYAALYEMVRVARKAVIIIEPQDPIAKMPLLLFLSNILEKLSTGLSGKIWKNRFSYEKVGNFVYKVSEREIEKFAAGLNLPAVAVKSINPNFWFQGSNEIPADNKHKEFRKIAFKKNIRDFLTKIGFLPSQTLSLVILKQKPDHNLKKELIKNGYRLIEIPENPYL